MTAENSIAARHLGVGLAGGLDAPWAADYFPHDLPADWRMDYYSNEFDCLLLAPRDWQAADPAIWAGWAASVGEDFRFYLQAGGVSQARQAELQAVFGDTLGGLLLPAGEAGPMAMWPAEDAAIPCWRDATGRRLCQLDIAGLDLRAQRAQLTALQPLLGDDARHDLIVSGTGVQPAQVAELRLLSEMLGLA